MYWSDWGKTPKIERAGMNGSNRKILFSKDLIWPNGLAIDHEKSRIYWVDGGTKAIEYSRLDGSGRTTLRSTFLFFFFYVVFIITIVVVVVVVFTSFLFPRRLRYVRGADDDVNEKSFTLKYIMISR